MNIFHKYLRSPDTFPRYMESNKDGAESVAHFIANKETAKKCGDLRSAKRKLIKAKYKMRGHAITSGR